MGWLDGLMGNASKVDTEEVERELDPIITDNEEVQHAYKIIRDLMIFTDKRLIMIDKQGVRGKKVDYHSIPYQSITHFSVETAGTFDLDAELKIWIAGTSEPITKEFRKDDNIYDVQKALAYFAIH